MMGAAYANLAIEYVNGNETTPATGWGRFDLGGDGGSRTPVQNPRSSASYAHSRHLDSSQPIPPTGLSRVSLTDFDDFAQANFIIAALLR
jgi:hypothetical protein